jgi:hypothetical protein
MMSSVTVRSRSAGGKHRAVNWLLTGAATAALVAAGTGTAGAAGAQTLPTTTTTTTTSTTTTSTTTTLPRSTTTTRPAPTTTRPAPPTTKPAPTTSTTKPKTTTTKPKHGAKPKVPTAGPPPGAPKLPVNDPALMRGLETDLDQLQALADLKEARSTVAATAAAARSASRRAASAGAAVGAAVSARHRAQLRAAMTGHRLMTLAVAAYTGEEPVLPVPPPQSSAVPGLPSGATMGPRAVTDPALQTADAAVLLDAVVTSVKGNVTQSRHQLAAADRAVAAAQVRYRQAARAAGRAAATAAGARATLTATIHAAVTPGVTPPALPMLAVAKAPAAPPPAEPPSAAGASTTTGRGVTVAPGATTTTTTVDQTVAPPAGASPTSWKGPTILGVPALSAADLAGWYASTRRPPHITVPMAQLAADYLAAGSRTGVRGDIAFAQSVVETDYFGFPSFGQVTRSDNNFAGIGACDSCASGWSFPNALAGVSAQVELLEAYASPTPVPTPLVGPVGVGGCCQTWMSLAGTWATNPDYGVEILSVYKQMLDWAIPRHLAAAGLHPAAATPGRSPAPAASTTTVPAAPEPKRG